MEGDSTFQEDEGLNSNLRWRNKVDVNGDKNVDHESMEYLASNYFFWLKRFLQEWVYPLGWLPGEKEKTCLNLKKIPLEKLRQDGIALRTIRITALEMEELEAAAVEALAAVRVMRRTVTTNGKLVDQAISIRLAQMRLNRSLKAMNMANYIIGNTSDFSG